MNILENIKYYAATSESRIAIKSGDSVLTYKQLEEYSNRLAAWINRNLSSNKVPIVVYGHKNPYMVVCFLACVKSGRAYCPQDISIPDTRVMDTAECVNPEVIFKVEGDMDFDGYNVKNLDSIKKIIEEEQEEYCPEWATKPEDTYEEQLNAVLNTYDYLLTQELKGAVAILKRYFLSDAANQADTLLALTTEGSDCALSIVEQPPLDGTKIALWVYLLTDVQTQVLHNGLFEVKHSAYRHFWGGSAFNRAANSEYQTRLLLNDYVMQLMEQGCKLADNCIRTWFFVQNVDVNYAGVVKARNEVFVTQNLTEKTHYISSTGIDGRHADPKVLVQMDTYAVAGMQPEQIHFLYAPTHLNPTYEYGVSFERGTYVDYGDRRQVFISGTASINNKGDVVYPGNIRKQTERMWENVETLLKEAYCTFEDLGQMIVYLRDIADYTVVKAMYDKRFPHTPKVFVHAPVCRPGWLIEMECMGVKACKNKDYASF